MVKEYFNGQEFLDDNKDFLNKNELLTIYYRFDAPLYKKENNDKLFRFCKENEEDLLFMRVAPYVSIIYGNDKLVPELIDYLIANNIEVTGLLSETNLGDKFVELYDKKTSINHYVGMAMDMLKVTSLQDIDSKGIETPSDNDIDELIELSNMFVSECNITQVINHERIKERLNDFKVIRKDKKIASMASKSYGSKVASVYTRKEYRGLGLARIVVGTITNELIKETGYSCLFVDQKNPISNKLYYSLGYRKEFSETEYRVK